MSEQKEFFPNLRFSIQQDGLVLIEQLQNHEEVCIELHPQQLAHIGRALFGGRTGKDAQIAELQRKIGVLADRIGDLVDDRFIRDQIMDRCGDWEVILARWDHLLELALEFDIGLPSKAQIDAETAHSNGAASSPPLPDAKV